MVLLVEVRRSEARPALDEEPIKFSLDTGKSEEVEEIVVSSTWAPAKVEVTGSRLQDGMVRSGEADFLFLSCQGRGGTVVAR